MWNRNLDTGKWFRQVDTLTKETYNNLKIDLEKVKLYSKCLSGATYFTINDFDDLYPELSVDELGYYFETKPINGPNVRIEPSNSDKFYKKYLPEDGFTIKNLFTPEKLIESEGRNFITVDVATSELFTFITGPKIFVDGIQLIEGQRVLIKDQKQRITVNFTLKDTEFYFKNTLPVSSYTLVEDNGSSKIYEYYNSQNGIYEYDGDKLVRLDFLSDYIKARKLIVAVKLGETNADKQFHLSRLLNGYFPLDGENIEFKERTSWIVRNRVDYNNVYDLNFYDILNHGEQQFFDINTGITYSITPRTIAVGEFGSIINNQDRISQTATYSISNIISNKFKVNLRSITEVEQYYWICGDEGTLLQVSKIDFSIKKIDLNVNVNFTSISFIKNLYGVVVGKFNTIFTTKDGGITWSKIQFQELENFSYLSVLQISSNNFMVGGENGVLIEFTFNQGNWFAYKRSVTKTLGKYDSYSLVDDINDLDLTNWVNIKSFSFSGGLSFSGQIVDGYRSFGVDIEKFHFDSDIFLEEAQIYIAFSFSSNQYGNIYTNNFYGVEEIQSYDSYDLYIQTNPDPDQNGNPVLPPEKSSFTFSLPIDSSGNILNDTYHIGLQIISNYDPKDDVIVATYSQYHNYSFKSIKGDLILIGGNNQSVICYDKNSIISNISNNFIYASFTQSNISDVRSIERKKQTPDIYITSDKIYAFNLGNFNRFIDKTTNLSYGNLTTVQNVFANKITTSTQSIYLAGNNSVLKTYNLDTQTQFNDLDPTFNSRLKSKFLILDYDIGSKLNFFDDNGEYRLPDSITFPNSSFNATFSISTINNEIGWIDYYKDSEKVFSIGSAFIDSSVVKFSTVFSYTTRPVNYTITNTSTITKIGKQNDNRLTRYDNFKQSIGVFDYYMIPGINEGGSSEFMGGVEWIPPKFSSSYDLLLHKNISIFRRFYPTNTVAERNLVDRFNIGDVLYLSSDVVDTSLVINRISYYYIPLGSNGGTLGTYTASRPIDLSAMEGLNVYLYTISNFNENIINNLSKTTNPIKVKNLNQYSSVNDLIEKINLHPIGIGYKLSTPLPYSSNNLTTVECLFNEKTAYYNMQSLVRVDQVQKEMRYKESFMNFGYSPTYNIYNYLNKIDPFIFGENKEFTILPVFRLGGNNGNTFTPDNVYVDSGLNGASQSNILLFGANLKLQWESLLENTFIDLRVTELKESFIYEDRTLSQMLITEKYYVSDLNAYAIRFNQKLTLNKPVQFFTFFSRRKLTEISLDLQLLNNIQRSQVTKMIQEPYTFTNYENSIKTKFSTDNYLKVLVSDYDIRQNVSAILYTDKDFQISMNILNLESFLTYQVSSIRPAEAFEQPGYFRLSFTVTGLDDKLKPGDLIFLNFLETPNSKMNGMQTVVYVLNDYVITSKEYESVGIDISFGTLTFIKKDPFFNYQPVDIFRHGSDSKVTSSVELLPNNYLLTDKKYSLINVDLNKYKIQMVDGLSLETLSKNYHWILEAEVSDALIGQNTDGLIWYSGIWRCGRWFGGTWMSGEWLTGDWYRGTWNAFNILNRIIDVKVDESYSDRRISKWYNGRWFEGTWNNGTWYNGRRYTGDWNNGVWFNGVWNDGDWYGGVFLGGIWVDGTWESGIFNCDSKPAYWLNGTFKSGDFENGIWYNGLFGNDQNIRTRFGTRASNTRTATWHGGNWIDGEFHSGINIDDETGTPTVSDMHKFAVWKTGIWNRGNWYGGVAYNIDFRGGIWHGGILEEVQVIGIDRIYPQNTSTNAIHINGIFKFNIGNEITIIDDYRNLPFSKLGNNERPMTYRINKVVENYDTDSTSLYLNYSLATLGVSSNFGSITFSVALYPTLDLGLRVVSRFTDVNWKSGLWTNGIFTNGKFDSGIWYNGVFDGIWGN
jgi:hypothetical protein